MSRENLTFIFVQNAIRAPNLTAALSPLLSNLGARSFRLRFSEFSIRFREYFAKPRSCARHPEERVIDSQFLLEILRTANAKEDFSFVLEAVSRRLEGRVPFDAISVVTVHGPVYRFYSLFVRGVPVLRGETYDQTLQRVCRLRGLDVLACVPNELPLSGSGLAEAARQKRSQFATDLRRSAKWPEDPNLLHYGIVSYVRCPLFVHDELIGGIKFWRRTPTEYSDTEITLLDQAASAISTTLYNRLAFEQIATLSRRLEADNLVLKQDLASSLGSYSMVGVSPSMAELRGSIARVGPTLSTVLICGETGTGKELVARSIHEASTRRDRPLIRVNCAAIPESLLASELFGHERGAFTGAAQRRIGRFELASEATIFLDEVGELPLEVQSTLLRVLQEKEFERLGGSQTLAADVRVIAATNRDLPAEIAAGRFRADLYYRLNVFPLHTTPLRERPEDIPPLVEQLIATLGARLSRRPRALAPGAIETLRAYSWPGNVRELQNVIERAMILNDGEWLSLPALSPITSPSAPLLETALGEIENALRISKGRVSGVMGAAHYLKIPASTLESRIRALGIDKFKFKSTQRSGGSNAVRH